MVLTFKALKKRLVVGKRRIQGRSHGLISVKHKGGAFKRNYRFIEYYRQKWLNIWLFVLRIEYDPNRNAYVALCSIIKKGIYLYIVAVDKMVVGSILATKKVLNTYQEGFATQLREIPDGYLMNNVELYKNSGSKLSRAAGTSTQLVNQFNSEYSLVKLSSKEFRIISGVCYGTLGVISNVQKKLQKYKKAGELRGKGRRPHVRGLAMNPVDHPHGGRTKGGMHWRTYSGKLTSNVSTRKRKKITKKFIVIGHRKQRLLKKEKRNG